MWSCSVNEAEKHGYVVSLDASLPEAGFNGLSLMFLDDVRGFGIALALDDEKGGLEATDRE